MISGHPDNSDIRMQIDWSNETKRNSNFAKLQFVDDKIDQNTNFAKLPSAKSFFFCTTEILIVWKLKFCHITQLFCVCQVLWWEKIWENWENFFFTKSQPQLYPTWICWKFWTSATTTLWDWTKFSLMFSTESKNQGWKWSIFRYVLMQIFVFVCH